MRQLFNIKTGTGLIALALFAFASGCDQLPGESQETEATVHTEAPVQAQPQAPAQNRQSNCEVEKKGQQVKNKLLMSAENMTSTMNKLHEVLEKHDHSDITEHSLQVEGYTIDLMMQSSFLPMSHFNSILDKSERVLELSTHYAWDNKYHKFAENSGTFKDLERVIDALKDHAKGMDDLPATICETEMNVAKKEVSCHLSIMNIFIAEIDKATDKNCLACVSGYCEKVEGHVKAFRETITNISTDDFTTINRTLADIEHSIHEMQEKAEEGNTEDLHHEHENIVRHMERLAEEVGEIR